METPLLLPPAPLPSQPPRISSDVTTGILLRMFIGDGGPTTGAGGQGVWAQGTPRVPSHSTDMQGFIKGGSGGGRRALLSHHLSKGQIKKYSQGPGSRKTVIIVLCHLLGELQVLLLTLPALLESKGRGWWQLGTEATSFPWPRWLQRPR